MTIEFTNKEIIETLEMVGYEIVKDYDDSIYPRRKKFWNRTHNYVVIIDGVKHNPVDIFKSEILRTILNRKYGN